MLKFVGIFKVTVVEYRLRSDLEHSMMTDSPVAEGSTSSSSVNSLHSNQSQYSSDVYNKKDFSCNLSF